MKEEKTRIAPGDWVVIDGGTAVMLVPGGLLFKSSDFGGDSGVALAVNFVPCCYSDALQFIAGVQYKAE